MPPYVPSSLAGHAGPRGRLAASEVERALPAVVRSLLCAARTSQPPPTSVGVACIRLAAAHQRTLRPSRPELWRDLERFYRQHLRPALPDAEARHWDGALRLRE
jgi:hypothetical protein